MSSLLTTPLLAVILSMPSTAPASDSDDLARFQGTWKGSVGKDTTVGIVLIIEKSNYTVSFSTADGASYTFKGEFKLDEKAKPATIDFVKSKGPDGQEVPETLGLYQFEGNDTLKLCTSEAGQARPGKIEKGENDTSPYLVTYTRQK